MAVWYSGHVAVWTHHLRMKGGDEMSKRTERVRVNLRPDDYEQLEWLAGLSRMTPPNYAALVLSDYMDREMQHPENNGQAFNAWKLRRRDPLGENL